MKLNEKIKPVSILKELIRTGELDVSNSSGEKLPKGGNIRTIYMKGDVITIYLSKTMFNIIVK